jgi:hypothetical protein
MNIVMNETGRMRKTVFLLVFLGLSLVNFAQTSTQSVGIYTCLFGAGSSFVWSKGGGSNQIERVRMIGVEYVTPVSRWLKLAGGIEFSDMAANTSFGDPGSVTRYGHVQLITVPIYFRADVWKYLFFTFGALVDFQLKNDVLGKFGGGGITGGTGFKYDFKKNTTVFLHPYYQLHFDQAMMITGGLRAGLSYRF